MDESDKQRLRMNRELILDQVQIGQVQDFLYQESIISEDDIEKCTNVTKTSRQKMAELLDMLPRRGPNAYMTFCCAVEKTYPWVVEKLKSTVVPGTEMNTETDKRCRIREPYKELDHAVFKIVTRSEALKGYKRIIRELGVPQADIDQIEYANHRDLQEQFYQCLNKWKSRSGKSATVNVLIRVLRDEDYNDVADKLDGYTD